ncbi:hypothetical protein UCDDS831_g07926 [Diplodia seriata]|uniref:Uncharacterized protein n=1 Tax=Diplodia seriata TaxID=420778 RepID=A0A0G2FSI0_9PEZI|nr:hypothetical protein UCDDS831_g07926 [Diplodia seriata]
MPAITPSSTTWTLRLKHNKTTVLLHVDPLQTLASVRAELLHCLRETFPEDNNNNNGGGRPLPADPAELQLAKMRDPSDPERGWVLLVSGGGGGGGGSDEKGKGRAKAKAKAASGGGGGGGADSLKAVGVKDNSVLAFRWGVRAGRDGDGDGDAGGEMELDEDDEDGEGDVGDDDDDAWDVVLPKYEDSYMDALEDEGIVE